MVQYASGQRVTTSLTGSELVSIDAGGATLLATTTAAIASLSGSGTTMDFTNTAITTVGNGTLTAAGLIGGIITRTGPVANFTDTLATAAQIVTAIGTFVSGATVTTIVKNATQYTQTLAAPDGTVILSPTHVIGPFMEGEYYGVIGGTAAAPTITYNHVLTTSISLAQSINSPQVAAINTVGAGTLTAAAMAGGLIVRGGSQSATPFTDTTDTAANIIAASLALIGKTGGSFLFEYSNTTNAVATIAGSVSGGTVTMAGVTTVPPNTIAQFLVRSTGATEVTITGTGVTQSISTQVTIGGATSGYVSIQPPATAGAVTLTTPPLATSGTVATTSGANLFVADVYRSTASTALANNTAGAINGMSALPVAVGTYTFRLVLPNTANGTSGVQTTFTLTTAVLSAISSTSVSTATGVASVVQYNATTTSATALFANTAASLLIIVEGSFTVSTAGTITFNAALNTGTTAAVIQAGAYAQLIRIA